MSNRAELVFVLREEAAPNTQVGQAAANPRPQSATQPGQAASAAGGGFSNANQQSIHERLAEERRRGTEIMAERRAAAKEKWDTYRQTGRLPGAAAAQPQATPGQPPVFPGSSGPQQSQPGPPPVIRPGGWPAGTAAWGSQVSLPPMAQRVIPTAAKLSARALRFHSLRQRAARRKAFRRFGQAAGARYGPRVAGLAGRAAAAVGGLSMSTVVGIAAAGTAIAGVGVAAYGAVKGVIKLGEIAATAARDLEKFAQFSGEAAASLARIELRRLQMDITRAREIGGQSGQFRELTQRFSLIAERIYLLVEKASLHLIVPLLEGVMSGLTALAEWLEKSGLTEFVPFGDEIKRTLGDIRRLSESSVNLPAEADILGLFRNLPPLGVEWNGKRFSPQQGAPEAIDTHFAGPMPVLGGI